MKTIDIQKIHTDADTYFTQKNLAREHEIALSRKVIQLSGSAVRFIHRKEFAEAQQRILQARNLLEQIQTTTKEHPDLYFSGTIQDAQKEYAEAAVSLAIIQQQNLPGPADLQVEWAPYINGLGEAIGELRRHLLYEMIHDNMDVCEYLLQTMDDIYGALAALIFPDALTNNLRRTVDSARGIIEKTRGDFTSAFMNKKLQTHIDHMTRLFENSDSRTSPVKDMPENG